MAVLTPPDQLRVTMPAAPSSPIDPRSATSPLPYLTWERTASRVLSAVAAVADPRARRGVRARLASVSWAAPRG